MQMNVEPTDNLTSVICPLSSDTGFTLIELVIVIVILGIVGAMGADFISQAFRGFADTNDRMEIYEEGKFALVRMEREIRNAVPNAIKVSDSSGVDDKDTISFGVIDEIPMNNNNVFGQYTETDPAGTDSISDPIGTEATGGLPVNTLVSIYNTDWDNGFHDGSRIYRVKDLDSATQKMTLDSPIPVGLASPNQRYYAVSDKAIRYKIEGGALKRATADVTTNGVSDTFGDEKTLAMDVYPTNGSDFFSYSPGTLSRNGLVVINFSIKKRDTSVSFHKEIHIRNVP